VGLSVKLTASTVVGEGGLSDAVTASGAPPPLLLPELDELDDEELEDELLLEPDVLLLVELPELDEPDEVLLLELLEPAVTLMDTLEDAVLFALSVTVSVAV
jgi:hypothetical protein